MLYKKNNAFELIGLQVAIKRRLLETNLDSCYSKDIQRDWIEYLDQSHVNKNANF